MKPFKPLGQYVSPASLRVSVIATTDMGSCNQLSGERFYRDLSHIVVF